MKLSFYMPFKPPGHQNPSGDLITGMELYDFLSDRNHAISLASRMRSRWIYLKPWKFPQLAWERARLTRALKESPPNLWLTYHSYYKAPDLLGPHCSRKLSIPYVLFQGIYSTKRRRNLLTLPGFLLNRATLTAARMVFTNKRSDELNLKRLLPENRVSYIAPGLSPGQFNHDPAARIRLREEWGAGNRPVVMTTAMLRPGVKTEGVKRVISSCGEIIRRGHDIMLVVIGDGVNRSVIEREGRQKLGGNIKFLGKIARSELYRYYSGADVFAFPGIEESLGMVYLEAQSTGLPVVAYSDWGAREAVIHGQTGLLSKVKEPENFTNNINTLLVDVELRETMGSAAALHIRKHHDLTLNYQSLNGTLEHIISTTEPAP